MAEWFGVKVPDNIGVDEFFLEKLPSILSNAKKLLPFLAEIEFSLEVVVEGAPYGIVLNRGEISINNAALPNPRVRLEVNEALWRENVTGKINLLGADNFKQATHPEAIGMLATLKGKLAATLTRDTGPEIHAVFTFSGESTPEAAIQFSLEDFLEMNRGEIAGQMLFMQGRLAIKGDIGLVMRIQALQDLAR